MITLAMDTAGSLCSAAVHDSNGGRMLAKLSEEMDRGHAERLMDIIAKVLSDAGCEYHDLRRVVSTIGPGSFTGIRVGLATARGIGLGLGIPVVGVSTLEALHHACDQQSHRPVLVVLDARRGEAYYQLFDTNSHYVGEPGIAPYAWIANLADKHRANLCGSGVAALVEHCGYEYKILHQDAAADIASVMAIGLVKPVDNARPEPLYLRAPDAKPQSGFAVPRA